MSRSGQKLNGAAALLVPVLLLIAACDSGGTTSGPGAVSEGEAAALDEAAEMLEERQLPEGVLPPLEAPQTPAAEEAPQEEGAE